LSRFFVIDREIQEESLYVYYIHNIEEKYLIKHCTRAFYEKKERSYSISTSVPYSRPSTSLQRLIRLDRVNRRDRFSMKKPLRSSARGASEEN
jgi:hypothetical protein